MQYWSLHCSSFLLGGGPSRGRRQKQGEDVVHSLKVSLEDVFNGTTKKLSLSRNVLCAKCKGYGFIHVYIVCTSNFFLKFWQPIKFSFRICMLSLAALYQFDIYVRCLSNKSCVGLESMVFEWTKSCVNWENLGWLFQQTHDMLWCTCNILL
jgi:hypothetical protein